MKVNPKAKKKFDGAAHPDRPGWKPKKTHVELFEWLVTEPDATEPLKDALLVLCTPRCGSTLFCEALNSTGRLGHCEEWFNYEYFAAYMQVLGVQFCLQEYVNFVARKTMRDTGVWAIKWHVGQMVEMNQDFDLGMESMDFRHVVYLYRRDKIAQAVSLVRASATDQFRSYEEATGEEKMSRHAIATALEPIVKFDRFARQYLWKYVDAEYAYEDFDNLTINWPCFNAVLTAMGKEPYHGKLSAGRLRKQSNQTSRDAAVDFLKYIVGDLK
jgi:LPS sulfotransferase NodH